MRTVVFRGFYAPPAPRAGLAAVHLRIVTDARSGKVADAARNDGAEAAWYFPVTREQWRVAGRLCVVGHAGVLAGTPPGGSGDVGGGGGGGDALQAARADAWHALSDAARAQFAWPMPAAARPMAGSDGAAFVRALPAAVPPPPPQQQPQQQPRAAAGAAPAAAPSPVDGSASGMLDVGGAAGAGQGPRGGAAAADGAAPTHDDAHFGFATEAALAEAVAAAYANFALVLLTPDGVDQLCLKADAATGTQRRWRWALGAEAAAWEGGEVNP